ncbi:MAG TPA: signal peptidase II [Bacillota bacterium]|nr:signal peptidase II [Bacillota bacterium]
MPYFYLTVLLIFLDQTSKWFVQTKMFPMQSVDIVRGFFSITYATNYGAAFGILQSQTLLLIAVSLGVIVTVWINRRKMNGYPWVMQVGLAVALGGAVGNLIDRIRLGFVVDFINFYIWPIFNVADMAIVIGVVFILWGIFLKEPNNHKQQEMNAAPKSVSGEEK